MPDPRRSIPRPPRAVTLDCWATLLDDLDRGEALRRRAAALAALATRLGQALTPEEAAATIEAAWSYHVGEWRGGRLFGPEGAARWCLEELGLPADDAGIEELAEAIATGTVTAGTAVVDGAAEALAALRQAGIQTALICDTGFTPARCVRDALSYHGLELDHYFFSDEVGVPKPQPPIFQAALEATGAAPADAVHIGDLRRTDVAGARAAGMAAVRFAGVHDDDWLPEDCVADVEEDAVLYRWEDLAGLLGL
ncbi:MAG TPA: HAD family hydrolase [Actinomycetota bacterium]|nr:HAD family hydrolase [Actinomycetota bacterium]